MALPQPITNTDVYLSAVLSALIEVHATLARVEKELQQLNNAATQKPTIQLDVVRLADSITTAIQSQTKEPTKKPTPDFQRSRTKGME